MRMSTSTKKRKTLLVPRAVDSSRTTALTDRQREVLDTRAIYDHASRRDLPPAELKGGCYVKPYTLLEIEQLWAGQCDDRTRSRRPPKTTCYHIMIDGGFAACRPFRPSHQWVCYNAVLLDEQSLIPIGQVPTQQICRRNGCLQAYEAYLG